MAADGYVLSSADVDVLRAMKAKVLKLSPTDRPQPYGTQPRDATTFVRFKLLGALTPGGSASARKQFWSSTGSAWVSSTSTGDNITVYDELSHFRSKTDGLGVARINPCNARHEIIDLQDLALKCRATAKGAISTTTGGTVDGVAVMDDRLSPVSASTSELSVTNPWNYYLADNASCELSRNSAAWEITNVVLASETFETEEQVSGVTFQHKSRTIRVNPTVAESTWATWHTGSTCT